MESNCTYNNFQQAKPPLICSQQSGFWSSLSCTSTVLMQTPNSCHITWTCLYQTTVTKNLLSTSHQLFATSLINQSLWQMKSDYCWLYEDKGHLFLNTWCKKFSLFLEGNIFQYQRQMTKALALKLKLRTCKTHKTYYITWHLSFLK